MSTLPNSQPRKWTHREVESIEEWYEVKTLKEIAIQLKRSEPEVKNLTVLLGFTKTHSSAQTVAPKCQPKKTTEYAYWHSEEDKFLIDNWHCLTARQMALALNRGKNGVNARAKKLGLKKTESQKKEIIYNIHNNKYPPEQKKYIEDNWYFKSTEKIAEELKLPWWTIRVIAKKLGLSKTPKESNPLLWTEQENDYLKANWHLKTKAELGLHLGRNKHAVRSHAFCLGLTTTPKTKPNEWTLEEDQYLLSNWPAKSMQEIAIALDRTHKMVGVRINKVLQANGKVVKDAFKKGKWDEDENEYLRNNYGEQTLKVTATFLNRTEKAVKERIQILKLPKLTPEQRKKVFLSRDELSDAKILYLLTKDPEQRKELVNYPNLIQLKRLTISLDRKINQHE